MTATRSGGGYWVVASDGGVFAFGSAAFKGSAGGSPIAAPIAGMVAEGSGYVLIGQNKQFYSFP